MNEMVEWLRPLIEADKADLICHCSNDPCGCVDWDEREARCESELALLALYAEADHNRDHPGPADPAHLTTRFLAIQDAVALIGQGYRRRPGWKDDWRYE